MLICLRLGQSVGLLFEKQNGQSKIDWNGLGRTCCKRSTPGINSSKNWVVSPKKRSKSQKLWIVWSPKLVRLGWHLLAMKSESGLLIQRLMLSTERQPMVGHWESLWCVLGKWYPDQSRLQFNQIRILKYSTTWTINVQWLSTPSYTSENRRVRYEHDPAFSWYQWW